MAAFSIFICAHVLTRLQLHSCEQLATHPAKVLDLDVRICGVASDQINCFLSVRNRNDVRDRATRAAKPHPNQPSVFHVEKLPQNDAPINATKKPGEHIACRASLGRNCPGHAGTYDHHMIAAALQ